MRIRKLHLITDLMTNQTVLVMWVPRNLCQANRDIDYTLEIFKVVSYKLN